MWRLAELEACRAGGLQRWRLAELAACRPGGLQGRVAKKTLKNRGSAKNASASPRIVCFFCVLKLSSPGGLKPKNIGVQQRMPGDHHELYVFLYPQILYLQGG